MIPNSIGNFATVTLSGIERWVDIASAIGARDPANTIANVLVDVLLAAMSAHTERDVGWRICCALSQHAVWRF